MFLYHFTTISLSKADSTNYLDGLEDFAELKLVLVLDSGQAQGSSSLLVNDLEIEAGNKHKLG